MEAAPRVDHEGGESAARGLTPGRALTDFPVRRPSDYSGRSMAVPPHHLLEIKDGTSDRRTLDLRPGVIASMLVLFVYGGLALSVDFPRAAYGFQSDEATYYMMAYSLARDGDLEVRPLQSYA